MQGARDIRSQTIYHPSCASENMTKPLIGITPYPEGKDFAISFIDDTDLSTRENTEPVYKFLNSLNIKGTKTVSGIRAKRSFLHFAERAKCPQTFISAQAPPLKIRIIWISSSVCKRKG